MPVKFFWTRLIRFIAVEDKNTYYGDIESDDPDIDVGDPKVQVNLDARVITGNPFTSDYILTDRVLKVDKLLGPFTKENLNAIRCIGGNYASHLKEVESDLKSTIKPSRFPTMFPKLPNAIAGPGEDIEIPKIAQDDQADYENELTVVLGKDAKNVKAEDAWEYVLGYTVANDLSARKWQWDPELVGTNPPPQVSFSKSFDGFLPLGPCIVSKTIIKDPQNLHLKTWINGELRQNGSTSNMIFTIPRIIEFCSQGTTLQRGSIITTGTPAGVGYTQSPPQYLKPGDKVEMYIEKIGTLVHGIKYA